jgi:hypothetical protein
MNLMTECERFRDAAVVGILRVAGWMRTATLYLEEFDSPHSLWAAGCQYG